MVAVAFLTLQVPSSDADVAGNGTIYSPYSGHVTVLEPFAFYEVGTAFDCTLDRGSMSYGITSGFGLSVEDEHLYGTSSAAGVCEITSIGDYGHTTYTLNFVPEVMDGRVQTLTVGTFFDTVGIWTDADITLDEPSEIDESGLYYVTLDVGVHMVEDTMEKLELFTQMMDMGMIFLGSFEITDVNYDDGIIIMSMEFTNNSVHPLGHASWTPTYFVSNGEVVYELFEVEELYPDGTPTPSDPTRDGYVFTGWYEDPHCTQEWAFRTSEDWMYPDETSYPVRYIYAGWERDESEPQIGEVFSDADLMFEITGTDTVKLIDDRFDQNIPSWYLGDIVIPSVVSHPSGQQFTVNEIDRVAFSSCGGVRTITIPETVDTIGFCAFGYTYGLTDVYFEGVAPISVDRDVFASDKEDTIKVHTSGWNPLDVFTEYQLSNNREIQWVNEVPVLTFLSNPSDPLYATVSYGRE